MYEGCERNRQRCIVRYVISNGLGIKGTPQYTRPQDKSCGNTTEGLPATFTIKAISHENWR